VPRPQPQAQELPLGDGGAVRRIGAPGGSQGGLAQRTGLVGRVDATACRQRGRPHPLQISLHAHITEALQRGPAGQRLTAVAQRGGGGTLGQGHPGEAGARQQHRCPARVGRVGQPLLELRLPGRQLTLLQQKPRPALVHGRHRLVGGRFVRFVGGQGLLPLGPRLHRPAQPRQCVAQVALAASQVEFEVRVLTEGSLGRLQPRQSQRGPASGGETFAEVLSHGVGIGHGGTDGRKARQQRLEQRQRGRGVTGQVLGGVDLAVGLAAGLLRLPQHAGHTHHQRGRGAASEWRPSETAAVVRPARHPASGRRRPSGRSAVRTASAPAHAHRWPR
jgi:hypothetical protein